MEATFNSTPTLASGPCIDQEWLQALQDWCNHPETANTRATGLEMACKGHEWFQAMAEESNDARDASALMPAMSLQIGTLRELADILAMVRARTLQALSSQAGLDPAVQALKEPMPA